MSADERFDQRFDRIDQRFESFAEKFERVDRRINDLKDSLTSAKIWAAGLCCALAWSLVFCALARGFKWL
jgi:hypothetical protein